MSRPRISLNLPVTIAALVTAFLFGSLGTATAGGITHRVVKKIAAQVVVKKAPGLSVAHAGSADTARTATLVDGLSAADLKTAGYRYRLPSESGSGGYNFAFPGLPTGTYLVTFSVELVGATTDVVCGMGGNGLPVYPLSNAPVTPSHDTSCNGSGIVPIGPDGRFAVQSAAGATVAVQSTVGYPSYVTFVPIDSLQPGTATAS